MISFPNCKINLGLHILHKREDGFHDLETVFYPVGLKDALEIIQQSDNKEEVIFTQSGLLIDTKPADNLCSRAWQLLKKDFPDLPAIRLHLHKQIPMGAGLGGGSADAAFTLSLLNDKFRLGLGDEQLLAYAASLGSDAPFFVLNKPCYATGRGEILKPVSVDLSAYTIVLVNPGIHINTGWAFSQLTPAVPPVSLATIIGQPISLWQQSMRNDFEMPVFEKYPAIAAIKERLYNEGAVYASMSGSGSTVFGIFEKAPTAPLFQDQAYFVKVLKG